MTQNIDIQIVIPENTKATTPAFTTNRKGSIKTQRTS